MSLGRRVSLKPVLLLEISLIVLLAGIGAAFALNPATDMGDREVGVNYGDINDTLVTVTDYTLIYDAGHTNVTGVDVDLLNTDAAAHSVTVTVKIGNSDWSTSDEDSGPTTPASIGAGLTGTYSATLALAVTDLDQIEIVVEEVI